MPIIPFIGVRISSIHCGEKRAFRLVGLLGRLARFLQVGLGFLDRVDEVAEVRGKKRNLVLALGQRGELFLRRAARHRQAQRRDAAAH